MGFDVVYLPPIHPIGTSTARGATTRSTATADDPGSPWAIGGPEGGHDGDPPRPRHVHRLRVAGGQGPRARHGDRPRLRPAVLARPSLGQGASRSGSTTGPTARSPTPRTRRRSTRTSTRSTSGPPRKPTAARSGRRARRSSTTGSPRACASSASTTRTPSRWRSGSGSSRRCRPTTPTCCSWPRRSPGRR